MNVCLLAAADGAAVTMDFLKAQAGGTLFQTLTLYLFFAGTVAMGAGALYFFLLRDDVEPEYHARFRRTEALASGPEHGRLSLRRLARPQWHARGRFSRK